MQYWDEMGKWIVSLKHFHIFLLRLVGIVSNCPNILITDFFVFTIPVSKHRRHKRNRRLIQYFHQIMRSKFQSR